MKKKSTAAFFAALAVLAVGILASIFLTFPTRDQDAYTITLPGKGSANIDITHEIDTANRTRVQAVTIDESTIQSVVAALARPEEYTARYRVTYAWRDSETVFFGESRRMGELARDLWLDDTETILRQALVTRRWVYVWEEGGDYARFAKGSQDVDLYSGLPSWEDLLTLDPALVQSGGTQEVDGHLCLTAVTRDAVTGEELHWYILADNGLLLLQEGYQEGALTYRAALTDMSLGAPESGSFLLPDGSAPET